MKNKSIPKKIILASVAGLIASSVLYVGFFSSGIGEGETENDASAAVVSDVCKGGDVNEDGKVNGKDSTTLLKYLADWEIEINKYAADTNGDTSVNGKDSTVLMKYLADWDITLAKSAEEIVIPEPEAKENIPTDPAVITFCDRKECTDAFGRANQTDYSVAWDEEYGSVLKLTTNQDNANDPYINFDYAKYCEGFGLTAINASDYKYIVVTLKTVKISSCATTEIFYVTGASKGAQAGYSCSTAFDYSDDGWQRIVLTVKENFTDTLNALRLDYLAAADESGDGLYIYSIHFVKTKVEANMYSGHYEKEIGFELHPEVKEEILVDYTKLNAEYEDSSVAMWFDHITEKIDKDNTKAGTRETYVMRMAKNEIQSCQFFLLPENETTFDVSVTDFENENGDKLDTTLLYEYYAHLYYDGKKTDTPDAIPELLNPIAVKANETQGFVVKAKTTADTAAGMYEATITVKDAATGKEIKKAKVYTKVWDFTLSEDTALHTAVCTYEYKLIGTYYYYGMKEKSTSELYKDAYDFLLENRLCSYTLPYDIGDERLYEYLDNPRVNTFCVNMSEKSIYNSNGDRTGRVTEGVYEFLSQKQEWLDKAYFYHTDEPYTEGMVLGMQQDYDYVTSYFQNPNIVAPFYTDINLSSGDDQISVMSDWINIWCTKIDAFTPRAKSYVSGVSYMQNAAQDLKYGTYAERVAKEVADGDQMWLYFCWQPVKPYANWLANCDGTEQEITQWQAYQVGATGILYFCTNLWNTYVYKDLGTTQLMGTPKAQGDGILFYPGIINDNYDCVSSLRLEAIRDGIEDYQYMHMLEELCGREEVMKYVNLVTEDVVTYTSDDDYLAAVRVMLGNAVEKAVKEAEASK